jgi:SET domain-containing protein
MMEKNDFYTPLMTGLTIRESAIHGLGLFATKPIAKGLLLGVSHRYDERFQNNYVRTPLGGFINHNDDPNLVLVKENDLNYVRTIREVKVGEELTLKYTLYNVCGGTDFETKGGCVDMI